MFFGNLVYGVREELLQKIKRGEYEQLAGIGVLHLISLQLNVDILKASIEELRSYFLERINRES